MIQTSTPNTMKCLANFFSERGCPDITNDILSQALNRVQNVSRESASASNNEERIPFTLTLHPNNLTVQKRGPQKF